VSVWRWLEAIEAEDELVEAAAGGGGGNGGFKMRLKSFCNELVMLTKTTLSPTFDVISEMTSCNDQSEMNLAFSLVDANSSLMIVR
jgi:hypothetical protein